jgi:hypothetical protein
MSLTRTKSLPALNASPKPTTSLMRSKSLVNVAGELKPKATGEPQVLDQPNASQLQLQKQEQTLQDPTATGVVAVTAEGGTPPGGYNDFEWSTGSSGEGVNETGSGTESVPVAPEKPQPENAAHAEQNPAETPPPIRRAVTQQPDTRDASEYIDEASLDTPPVAADDLKVANDKVAESSAALEANKKAIEQDTKMVAFMVNMQKFVDGLLTQYPKLTAEDLAPLRSLFEHAQQVCQQQVQQKLQEGQTISQTLSQHVAEATRLSELARGGPTRPVDAGPPSAEAHPPASIQDALAKVPTAERAILQSGMEIAQKVIVNGNALLHEADLIEQDTAKLQRRIDNEQQIERSLAELESIGKRAKALDADSAQMLNASAHDEPMPTLDNLPVLNADSAPKEKSAAEMSVGELAHLAIQRNAAAKVHGNSRTAEAASPWENAEKELQSTRAAGDHKRQVILGNMTK